MLNRMAESFYWIGRYTERIDNNVRLMDVTYHAHHIRTNNQENLQNSLLTILGDSLTKDQKEKLNNYNILDLLTFDRSYENSIFSCVSNARQNVRLIREQVPSKIWDIINSFYLWLIEQNSQKAVVLTRFSLYEHIQQRVALFYGMADSIMLHENGWDFIQAGKFIERIGNIIRILEVYCDLFMKDESLKDEYHRLISILECVDGFEAFRKCHANRVNLEEIMEFLVLNLAFPRSISYSFSQLERHLIALQNEHRVESISKVNRLMTGVKANFLSGLHLKGKAIDQYQVFLKELLIGCNHLGMEIEKCYFYEKGEEQIESSPYRKVAIL